MTFNVEITLYGRRCIKFYKKIEAATAEQASYFAKQLLEGFIADNVTVKTKVIQH